MLRIFGINHSPVLHCDRQDVFLYLFIRLLRAVLKVFLVSNRHDMKTRGQFVELTSGA